MHFRVKNTLKSNRNHDYNVFESVLVVILQNVFYLKIYKNNIFLIFKNYF
jgi:hypothetical protein